MLWPESSKVDLEEELLEAFLIFLCLALLTTITPLANFCSLDNLGGGGGDLKKTSVIEFTTWFHEFSKYESTIFFTNTSQLKKQTNLIGQKRHFCFSVLSIWENQNKYYIIFCGKNRRFVFGKFVKTCHELDLCLFLGAIWGSPAQ